MLLAVNTKAVLDVEALDERTKDQMAEAGCTQKGRVPARCLTFPAFDTNRRIGPVPLAKINAMRHLYGDATTKKRQGQMEGKET